MTPEQLRRVVRLMNPETAAQAAAGLNAACARFGIVTAVDQANFAAQVVHETRGFLSMAENLNYAAADLPRIWPKHFSPELAGMYGRIDGKQVANQQMIANIAYANRMGNGSVESGDGWRYRGRGPGITGRDNYARSGAALGLNLIECPDQIAQIDMGCAAFGWFWKTNGLSALANAGKTDAVSLRVNGGALGLADRRALTDDFVKALA